jgi:hypothetical protein
MQKTTKNRRQPQKKAEPTKKEDPVLRGKSWRPEIPRPLMPCRFRPRPNRYTQYRTKEILGKGESKEVERPGAVSRSSSRRARENGVKREGDKGGQGDITGETGQELVSKSPSRVRHPDIPDRQDPGI